ncbi:MAG TPA: PIN domain-containing protein [Pyrinomonadaceae bacterium]|nr:PIN domain-containing protein [Pyrinomonadaceae bacterium]
MDTNIWLERLLGQEHSEDVGEFLRKVDSDQLFISDFSFHSVCLILARLKRPQSAIDFVRDLFVEGRVGLLTVRPEQIESVISQMEKFDLDFDDAYQYQIAERDDLILVSFDSDFAVTAHGRKTPAEVLKQL